MMYEKKVYCLSIAGLILQIETDQNLEVITQFCPFVVQEKEYDFRACFQQVDKLSVSSEKVLHEDRCYRVYSDEKGGYLRAFFDAPRDKEPYALAVYDDIYETLKIGYLAKGAHCVSEFHNAFFHLGFEELLIRHERICVHAACIESTLGGILFSGPSGIGKSTQAELWCEYCRAKQINGDRPILSKDDKGWKAWGSPYAGSSKYYVNQNCAVTAIVMLRQAENCSLRKMTLSEAFRAVWMGVTVHSWDKYFVEKACDLIVALVSDVPVFEFCCTPDKEAVDYLETKLRKECGL